MLEFSGKKGQATATLDGQEMRNCINVADQTISWLWQKTKWKQMVVGSNLDLQAKICEKVQLVCLHRKGKTSIPNTASFTVGFPKSSRNPWDSNRVPVTPSNSQKNQIKRMSMVEEETLASRNDEFTYHQYRKCRLMQQPSLSMMSWKTFLNLRMEQVVRLLA